MGDNNSPEIVQLKSLPLNPIIEKTAKTINSCIFVGDLGLFCTENELFEVFSVYGIVLFVHIKREKRDGSSLGYGFVTMSSHEEACNILIKLNGMYLSGRPMKLRWGIRKSEMTADTNNSEEKDVNIVSIYVKFKTIKVFITYN